MRPSRSGCSRKMRVAAAILLVGFFGLAVIAAEPEKQSRVRAPKAAATPSLTDIPLPIGHEAKGLVLPDYDLEGALRAKFEAAVAKRIDLDHVLFTGVKMTTYTAESTPDLSIDMPSSVLDLSTRVITSKERATITRADFTIAGDTLRFDTAKRTGSLAGNVKMVIKNQGDLLGKTEK